MKLFIICSFLKWIRKPYVANVKIVLMNFKFSQALTVILLQQKFYHHKIIMGQRVIGISGSLIWSKTQMELIFNPYGEFRCSPEGSVSQMHSPHLLVGATGIFSDLLRSVQMLKREWGMESNES